MTPGSSRIRRDALVVIVLVALTAFVPTALASTNDFSQARPGPLQAQVFIIQDPEATESFEPRPDRVQAMVARAITNLTGKATVPEAWRAVT